MKNFLHNFTFFILINIIVFFSLFLLSHSILRSNFYYNVAANKHILMIGDSHIECALNDSILKQSINLAQSGTSYFYSYIKLRELIKVNEQIDTVILGYSYHNLYKEWLSPDRYVERIRNYLPLMNNKDIFLIFKANPSAVTHNLPIAVFKNIQVLMKQKKHNIGGYLRLDRNILDEAVEDDLLTKDQYNVSIYESHYLMEIYKMCQENGVVLVLLNTPIHPIAEHKFDDFKESYFEFKKNNLPNSILINHSSFPLPDSCWGDIYHLNYKGAAIYTEFISNNIFFKDTIF